MTLCPCGETAHDNTGRCRWESCEATITPRQSHHDANNDHNEVHTVSDIKYTKAETEIVNDAYRTIDRKLDLNSGPITRAMENGAKSYRKESRFSLRVAEGFMVRWFLYGWTDPKASAVTMLRSDVWPVILAGAHARAFERMQCERSAPAKERRWNPAIIRKLRAALIVHEGARDRGYGLKSDV